MLEHVPLEDMRKALRNIHLMLRTGGVFRLVVPDIETRIMRYINSRGSTKAHDFHQDDRAS